MKSTSRGIVSNRRATYETSLGIFP